MSYRRSPRGCFLKGGQSREKCDAERLQRKLSTAYGKLLGAESRLAEGKATAAEVRKARRRVNVLRHSLGLLPA